eukprot:COSAG03_NODE_211_length_10586_cov_7.728140_5_plen_115_part_00
MISDNPGVPHDAHANAIRPGIVPHRGPGGPSHATDARTRLRNAAFKLAKREAVRLSEPAYFPRFRAEDQAAGGCGGAAAACCWRSAGLRPGRRCRSRRQPDPARARAGAGAARA